ncbi:hypothetical protein SAMN05518849_115102 [Sphingobium sp. AP50]|uniref:hypothetical protein n=1 Tax=Sphingobium sp. AP50 TaxID=1884369 RepID=UPI0008CA97E2|nr:hypothetical protein [Sphingobium sp. AP50]SEJ84784.1 hypothetical protein SAMN05518849_115102 [Sphingobium sp. AP50]
MAAELWINEDTGEMRIGDLALLQPYQTKGSIEPQVADLLEGSRDYGNGYEWLYLGGLTFGGLSARLALCFHNGSLEQASWNVQLPDAPAEGGWPTREAIDCELSFVRDTLVRDMNIHAGQMPWGEVWSSFDAKGFMAANGLRYAHR